MANRKRGTFSLPEELRTTERLSTKKEMAERKSLPPCPPVPNKVRKGILSSDGVCEKPKPVCFNQSVELSPVYNPSMNTPYLDQVFTKHSLVGEGSFGRVYRVRSREDNQLYAIKRLKSMISLKDRYAEVLNNEKIGKHPNCVQFFMAWEEELDVYMVLEYCDMSLAGYSILNHDISEDLLWNVLYDMCKGLDFLHKRDLLHLDVKPGNIMMKRGIYKLADFGILVDLKLAPVVCKSTLSDGDSKYLALEVLEGIYRPSCDIFGLGISLLELAADLELPSHGPLWQQLRHDVLPQNFYDRVSLGFKVIIERMLKPEYESRPTAEKLLKYNPMKAIEKRDMKCARIDYAVSYINNNDYDDAVLLHSLPIMINNNNNIIETPRVQSQTTGMHKGNCRDSNRLAGRKSLFHLMEECDSPPSRKHVMTLSEMNEFLEASFTSKSESSSVDTDNSMLACDMSDSNITGEILHMDLDTDERNGRGMENGEALLEEEEIISSTPIMRCRLSRRMPKTKLTFD